MLAIWLAFIGLHITDPAASLVSAAPPAPIKNTAVFSGSILSWDNGQGYAIFSAAFNPTKILIKNYSSRPVYYRITINQHTVVGKKMLRAGEAVYEKVNRPLFVGNDKEYTVRAFTQDSSTRKVYVRAVGIRQ